MFTANRSKYADLSGAFYTMGKDDAFAKMASHPETTQAQLVEYLLPVKGLPLEIARLTAQKIAERVFYVRAAEFLRGRGPDHRGRHLEAILSQDDHWWEDSHDFIQWVFPVPRPSEFNEWAPVLTRDQLAELGSEPDVRKNLIAAHERMLAFLGLAHDPGGTVFELPVDLSVFRKPWLQRPDHNDYRITRQLACLAGAGLRAEAKQFFSFLKATLGGNPNKAGSIAFWKEALKRA